MYLNTVLIPYYSSAKGSNLDLLDSHAVDANFKSITTNAIATDDALKQLNDRMARLEKLYDFTNRNFPHVLADFLATEGAKEKLGVTQPQLDMLVGA